ncbi:YeeE/YedE family protein [Aurantiacibacter suaedae]|uniref:YeeE/YedE family protein n=1 Tax=Aurantiacibacter suaedae TaxID=2545755 RepID=UPI00147822B9|nr:YeeE/YedE thiosulfate transporter family protein [Aurantiacibacter suaedae]
MLPGFPHAEPLAGLAGGVLIGLAAAVLLLGSGRIAGISGIFARATGVANSSLPRVAAWAFVLGLPLGAQVVMALNGPLTPSFLSLRWVAVAGLVVGIGTRLGSGCTSGHGVCGLSRLSPRSIVATLTFMATGIATVAIMNVLI